MCKSIVLTAAPAIPAAVTGSTAIYPPLKYTCIQKPVGSVKFSFCPPSTG